MTVVTIKLPPVVGPLVDLDALLRGALAPWAGRMPVGAHVTLDARATWYVEDATVVTLVTRLRRGAPESIGAEVTSASVKAAIEQAIREADAT